MYLQNITLYTKILIIIDDKNAFRKIIILIL